LFYKKAREPRLSRSSAIRCLVVGYGGANNTGAEARAKEAIKQMLDADERISITLTSLDRSETLRYISENSRLKVVEVNPIFVISVLRLVLKSDMVVLVEGSCFKDNFSSALLWFFMYSAELGIKLGKPTLCYAVDAGHMKTENTKWARFVAENMDLVITRTKEAKDILKSIGVSRDIKVTTDTAFNQHSEDSEWVNAVLKSHNLDPSEGIIGIAFEELFWWPVVINIKKAMLGIKKDHYKSIYYHSWNDEAKERSEALKKTVAVYADWAASTFNSKIIFFAMERLDISPCKDVQVLMNNDSILFDSNNYNAAQITGFLRSLSWLVTCRYHALVLSMQASVPMIGLAHDERIESIMNELDLKNDYFINYLENDIFRKLKEKTQKLVYDKKKIIAHIQRKFPLYIEKMNMNQRYFSEFVKERFPEEK